MPMKKSLINLKNTLRENMNKVLYTLICMLAMLVKPINGMEAVRPCIVEPIEPQAHERYIPLPAHRKPQVQPAEAKLLKGQDLGPALQEMLKVADGVDIMQAKVLNQFTTQGSTNASCAYQAVRNGSLLALAAHYPERANEYVAQLSNVDDMKEQLSFPRGKSRIFIIQNRVKDLAKQIITRRLLEHFKGEPVFEKDSADEGGFTFNRNWQMFFNAEEERWNSAIELEMVVKYVTAMGGRFEPTVTDEGLIYHLTFDEVYKGYNTLLADDIKSKLDDIADIRGKIDAEPNQVKKHELENKGALDQARYDIMLRLLNNEERLRDYLNAINVEFTITFDGKMMVNGNGVRHGFRINRSLDGDWVETPEMPLLLEHETNQGLLQGHAIEVGIFNFVEYEMAEDANNQVPQELNGIVRKLKAKEDFTGLIAIYIPGGGTRKLTWWEYFFGLNEDSVKSKNKNDAEIAQNAAAEGDHGHWISLVVNVKEGMRQYLVTDSGSNKSRLKDPAVTKLINILERATLPELVVEDPNPLLPPGAQPAPNNAAREAAAAHQKFEEASAKREAMMEKPQYSFFPMKKVAFMLGGTILIALIGRALLAHQKEEKIKKEDEEEKKRAKKRMQLLIQSIMEEPKKPQKPH